MSIVCVLVWVLDASPALVLDFFLLEADNIALASSPNESATET